MKNLAIEAKPFPDINEILQDFSRNSRLRRVEVSAKALYAL